MLVRNWMTTNVVTVGPDTSMLRIGKILREKNIRRLPVIDKEGMVIGIISDRDVRDASPSKATTLDMYEMNYLLAEIKAKEIMTSHPCTVRATDSVEKAAMLMIDKKIGGLPVVDENNRLEGIITEQDVFSALVEISGAREGGIQIGIEIPNRPGSMKPIFDLIRLHGARILTVLSTNNNSGNRHVFIRLREISDDGQLRALLEDIGEKANLLYWATDEGHFSCTDS